MNKAQFTFYSPFRTSAKLVAKMSDTVTPQSISFLLLPSSTSKSPTGAHKVP